MLHTIKTRKFKKIDMTYYTFGHITKSTFCDYSDPFTWWTNMIT